MLQLLYIEMTNKQLVTCATAFDNLMRHAPYQKLVKSKT